MVHHSPIACDRQITVSLRRGRNNPQDIVVATGLKLAEKLVLMLLLDIVQDMFGVDDLTNEKGIFCSMCVSRKRSLLD